MWKEVDLMKNKLYGITTDYKIVELSLCTCKECQKRGMYEVFMYSLKGEYFDCVKLDEINNYVKYASYRLPFLRGIVSKHIEHAVVLNKYTFNRERAVSALQNLSYHILNPLNDDNVFELVQLINHCEDLEKALDKACEQLENLSYVRGMGQVGMNFKEWKEWLKENVE